MLRLSTMLEIKFLCFNILAYVATVGKNENGIKKYIGNQLKEDMDVEQLSMDKIGSFTGSKN